MKDNYNLFMIVLYGIPANAFQYKRKERCIFVIVRPHALVCTVKSRGTTEACQWQTVTLAENHQLPLCLKGFLISFSTAQRKWTL